MGLHFLSSDYGMRLDHREAYDRTARWVLAGAVLAGCLLGRSSNCRARRWMRCSRCSPAAWF